MLKIKRTICVDVHVDNRVPFRYRRGKLKVTKPHDDVLTCEMFNIKYMVSWNRIILLR